MCQVISQEEMEPQDPIYQQDEDLLKPWIDTHKLKKVEGTWYKDGRCVVTGGLSHHRLLIHCYVTTCMWLEDAPVKEESQGHWRMDHRWWWNGMEAQPKWHDWMIGKHSWLWGWAGWCGKNRSHVVTWSKHMICSLERGLGPYLWIPEERYPGDVWALYERWWTDSLRLDDSMGAASWHAMTPYRRVWTPYYVSHMDTWFLTVLRCLVIGWLY